MSNWENFTRVYPSANYNIYARAASSTGGQFEVERVTNSTPTTTNQTAVALGRVNVPDTGGSKIFTGQLTPVTDAFGNTVVLPLSGTVTLRQTALAADVYNLEYFAIVTNSSVAGTLTPYLATATPAPNATGVALTGKMIFVVANRQTSVTNIQLYVDTTNITTGLTLVSNLVGDTLTYSVTTNLPANATNTLMLVITDNTGAKSTDTWTFVTAASGGVAGNGVWSGAGSDTNWSTAANWTGGTPGPGFSASFENPASTTNLVVNNIVSTNVTVQVLNYSTNNNGYQTTMIQPGVTLTVSNPAIASTTAAVQVGGAPGGDNVFNKALTNTITGIGGTLLVTGPLQQNSNNLNFQVRQCSTNLGVPYMTTLDMSGLGTMIANCGKFYVAQGGSGASQSNVSGRVFLAMTNTINLLRPNAGQFEVGDSSGGSNTCPGSSLYLGITNAIFADTMRIGKQKATNNLFAFNPAFASMNPVAYIRGTNGSPTGRVTTFTIGDADTEVFYPINVDATVDFSGGAVNALISTMIMGEGCTSANDTGHATGILNLAAGAMDVLDFKIANQRAANTAPCTATVNVNGSSTLLCSNIEMAHITAGATGLVTANLNITNGTVRASVTAEGGTSTINLIGGTLIASNNIGASGAAVSLLNLSGGSLHMNANGTNTKAIIYATNVVVAGTTVITIDTVSNVTGPTTVHLISYTGTDPYSGLSLAPLPGGYSGTLVDNAGSIDLSVNVAPLPPQPTILGISVRGGQVVLSGTNNNNGAAGNYYVLTSTNLNTPLSNWTVITNGSFSGGLFSSTNLAGTNSQRFFILGAP